MNTNELKAAMKRNDDTQEKLAEALGLQVSGVSERVNGKIEFRRSEINTIRERYKLSAEETIKIFFT
jgi:transcriptional regulator with XRE-family HTH domain